MDRRTFLHGAGAGALGLGASAVLGGLAEGCGGPPHTSTAASTSTSTAHGPPNWAALAATLTGTLVLPAEATYPTDVANYNELYSPTPAAIAYCASATDVQRCVAFARDHGVAPAARSGGHSYGGYSSGPGLVIDVSRLNTVETAPTTGAATGATATATATATIGAGTKLIEVYSQLGADGVFVPGGSCPTVGIAGLALGGGIGVFGRAYGLTCDNITALDVVTADGARRTCSATQHEDLYWAHRGGGGGNFGVVTSFTFKVAPIPDVNLFTLEWPWAEAATVLDAWLHFMPATPDQLWSNCQLLANGQVGSGTLKVAGVFAGSTAACVSALAPLLSAVGAAPTYRFVGPEDYLNAMMIEGGCEGKTPAQCAAPVRSPFAAKSAYVTAPLGSAGTTAVVQAVELVASEVPGAGGGIVFDAYGGAINRVAAGATAFVHRDAIACAQYSITYASAPPTSSELAAAHAWLGQTERTFAPYAHGSYQNYIDPTLEGWASAYYGANLPRLMTVKGRYDPDDFFHFAQSIPLPDPLPGPRPGRA